jgi:signal transduction histidine kinase
LTNVMRHAAATQVSLAIRIDGRTLQLHIADNGSTARGAITPGSGIVGMAERARLLGGMLTAQPGPSGGFEVVAALPLEDGK